MIKNRLEMILKNDISENSLINFIYCIENEFLNNPNSEKLIEKIIVASTVAISDRYIEKCCDFYKSNSVSRILATVGAAKKYLENPTDDNWDIYFYSSTNSYPFGAGDGCYSIYFDGDTHKEGSGCITGVGFLGITCLDNIEVILLIKNSILEILNDL